MKKKNVIKDTFPFKDKSLSDKFSVVESSYKVGEFYYNNGDTNNSSKFFMRCFKNNAKFYSSNGYMEYTLGNLCLEGIKVNKNYKKALHYFVLASYKGLPEAYYSIGNLFYGRHNIYGKEKAFDNINQAIDAYKKAHDLNYYTATLDLAILYYNLNDYQASYFYLIEAYLRIVSLLDDLSYKELEDNDEIRLLIKYFFLLKKEDPNTELPTLLNNYYQFLRKELLGIVNSSCDDVRSIGMNPNINFLSENKNKINYLESIGIKV